ncbi:MAG: hypothetical protein NUV80_01230 [Candidatus Berkelbacteria bacterium]|nr:hypothetical protein [Candidatus Berkelbacteria bacterium]
MKSKCSFITDERTGQYTTKAHAIRVATRATRETKIPHIHCLTTTWRDLEPKTCWTIMNEKHNGG